MERDFEKLINVSLDLAEKLLIDYKEYYPFGAIINNDGQAKTVTYSKDDDEFPESTALIKGLTKHLENSLIKNEIVAYAVIYDVRITEDDLDAICINLKHKSSIKNLICYYPYKINENGELTHYKAWREN